MSKFEGIVDLSKLQNINEDVLGAALRDRFLSDTIYTAIGSSAIVAVNPHKYVTCNSDAVLAGYAHEYRDTAPSKVQNPPHIFQLANNAYYNMRRTSQDQSILFTGETGSGKSENRRLALKSIIELSSSNPGKKGAKLASQIPSAEFVLESFGNARTMYNPNASRFGKYTELQFSERGRLSGVKTLDYYLEKNRVAGVPSGERNFHIFYYLLAGASQEERQHLHLVDKATYKYLGPYRRPLDRDDDANRFEQLKIALKTIGFSKRHVAQTCQLLAAILHLGNLDFTVDKHRNEDAAVVRNTDILEIVAEFLGVPPGDLEAVLSYKTKLVKKELCTVFLDEEGAAMNRDDLAKTLYSLLFAWLNESINQKLCRDDFATFIGLFDLPGSQNLPQGAIRTNSLDQFCVNFANERLHNWIQKRIFDRHTEEYAAEGIQQFSPQIQYFDNSECVRMITHHTGGLIHIMDDQARRAPKKTEHTMLEAFGKRWANHSSFKAGGTDRTGFPTFTINHYNGAVTYSSESWLDKNHDALNPDFVSLLRGSNIAAASEQQGSNNPFIQGLFSAQAIATEAHPRNQETIVAAKQPVKPMRAPSTKRKQTIRRAGTQKRKGDGAIAEEEDEDAPNEIKCVAGEFNTSLTLLLETLDETESWFVFCINPNDSRLPNQMENRGVKAQIRSMGLSEVAKKNAVVLEVNMSFAEFRDRYGDVLRQANASGLTDNPTAAEAAQIASAMGLGSKDIIVGNTKVFLTHKAFHRFEDPLRASDVEEQKRNRMRDAEAEAGMTMTGDTFSPYQTGPPSGEPTPYTAGPYGDPFGQSGSQAALPLVAHAQPFQRADMYEYDDHKSLRSDDFDAQSRFTSQRDDVGSNFGTESYAPSRNMFQNADRRVAANKDPLPGEIMEGEVSEEIKDTPARRKWVALCWALTWWLPNFVLRWVGRMNRMDVRQAWREKLAINMIIWFICGCAVFVIAVMGNLICPREYVFDSGEVSDHSYLHNPKATYISIRGEVFDLTKIAQAHFRTVPVVPQKLVLKYGGTDASELFPVQVSALCQGKTGSVNPYVTLNSVNTTDDANNIYHDFRAYRSTGDGDWYNYRPDWYFEQMVVMRYHYRLGFVGISPSDVRNRANNGRLIAIYRGLVYDLTDYVNAPPSIKVPDGQAEPGGIDRFFMHDAIVDVFKQQAGKDVTKLIDGLSIDPQVLQWQRTCMRNLFTIGKADRRQSVQCQFATYILLVLSCIMVSIIGFKFLAALHFGSPRAPEDHDKFVICQVPCYTEGEDSLRRTIDSLAKLKYDDKRKLLFIICDGMIVGSGNDRPTPRIVLDILGADPNLDPEPLSFHSLGEGAKQHNMGKVYSGLYECAGHVVPYLVLVKIGKPTERQRPGNRGKRDSQMALMHFLNKVHFGSPMNPLELEMYHQIKNVIGVNPTFYEYCFMVDADTVVDPLSLNRLVSAMMHDKKVLGVCGETSLANSKQSIITMMQVYEYFISHHLAKAFESLFGSVTCLPGCFTMYRLRTADTHKPLFISKQVIEDYSENRVDTLHMKNLLHLGEDRYLTTLLLKHFPNYKTQFVRDAHAYTVAPDEWSVLLSQRRRWINSTIHNLAELVFLDRLCGFCCFSMRFVVFIDLLSTLVQPVSVAYLGYLVYLVAVEHKMIPQLSLIMLAAIYGFQALIFIFRRKWDMIGWMIFYILAIPAFSFFLPLYSFWKMDDFSWGATRVVLGEKGKKLIVHDEGKFDPRSIPLKSWNDYENELWDKESNHSIGSWIPPEREFGHAESRGQSLYGGTQYDMPRSRSFSPAPSLGLNSAFAPLAYPAGSGGNTPGDPHGSRPASRTMLHGSASRPPTAYLDMPMPRAASPMMGGFDYDQAAASPTQGPSDHELENAVRELLRNADLNSVTKRAVRQKLEERFGMDLSARKTTINSTIDRVLLSQN